MNLSFFNLGFFKFLLPLFFLFSFLLLVLTFVLNSFLKLLLPLFFKGAIYVPTSKGKIKKIVELADIKPGDKAVDLGSGDGRVVMALARAGANAYGYEVNPVLVNRSRKRIKKAGLQNKAHVKWKNFWEADLSGFDLVVIYGMSHVMKRLEKKLERELRKGAKVAAVIFELPSWAPEKKEENIYLYKVE